MAGYRNVACRLARSRGLLAGLLMGVCALVGGGCAKRADLHPALRIEGEDLDRAIRRGKSLITMGADPSEAYARGLMDVNVRASAYVILRSAGCCWPDDEVAFQIAKRGDASDAGVRQAVREALQSVERMLKVAVVVQVPKDRDPASIEFLLRTNTGTEYPALEVEVPVLLQDVKSFYDPDAPPSGLYYYIVKFPVRGGPGVPPIGPSTTTLHLVVRDGELEATAAFSMPRRRAPL